MKHKQLKRVLIILGLLVLVGQTFFATSSVLADKIPSIHQLDKDSEATEQTTRNQLTKTNYLPFSGSEIPTLISKEKEEPNNANAPPQLEGILSTDKDGNLLYEGEAVLYEDGNVPANMEELFKKGVPANLKTRNASASIEYLGPITWGLHTVGNFRVNGKQAFCLQHPKGSPPTGTTNDGAVPYNNDSIKAILYWGWGGPKNIFSDEAAGIVSTALALSVYYNGDGEYLSMPPGYDTLLKKAEDKDAVPGHKLQLNNKNDLVKLNVTFDGKTQKSETVKLNGDTKNTITFSLGKNITFVNETTGKKATSGNVTVKGEDKFHFEADAVTKESLKREKLQGTVKAFQPLVVKPHNSGLQDLGTWKWYDDPAQTVSFEVNFVERTGTLVGKKINKATKKALPNFEFEVAFDGKTQKVKTDAQGEFKVPDIMHNTKVKVKEVFAPAPYVLDPSNQEKEVTITAGKEATVEFQNEVATGKTSITKEDSNTDSNKPLNPNYPLTGAKYGLFKEDGTLVKEVTLGDSLAETLDKLALGKYYWQETVSPIGYKKDPTKYPVDLSYKDQNTPVVVKDAKSQDDVLRLNMDGQKLLQNATNEVFKDGIEFTMTNLRTGEKHIETTATVNGKKGYFAFKGLTLDDYELTETKGVEGYEDIEPILIKHTYDKEKGVFKFVVSDKTTGNTLNEESYTQLVLSGSGNVDLGTFILKDKVEVAKDPKFDMSSFAHTGDKKTQTLVWNTNKKLSDTLTIDYKNMKAGTKRAYEGILVAVSKTKKGEVTEKEVWKSKRVDYTLEGDGEKSFEIVSDYNYSTDKDIIKYYFKANDYTVDSTGKYTLDVEHNKRGKDEAQVIDVIYPEISIASEAGIKDSKDNVLLWGEQETFTEKLTLKQVNVPIGSKRAYVSTLVAVQLNEKNEEVEKEVWKSKQITYDVTEETQDLNVAVDYDTTKDKGTTRFYFKTEGYYQDLNGKFVKDSEHNQDGKDEAQAIKVLYPKVSIGTQAHTGDGKTNLITWGELMKFHDEVAIGHENIKIGNTRAFETILVAVYPVEETAEKEETTDSTNETTSSSEGTKTTQSADQKETDKPIEKDVWSSGKIDYEVTEKELIKTVISDYDYTKDPKGTTYYFKEIGYRKVNDKEYEKDSEHNTDGKEKKQSFDVVEPKVTISTQAHTGDNKNSTITWGEETTLYDDVKIAHKDFKEGMERAFETILVAVYPADKDSKEPVEKDVWSSGKVDYKVSDKEFAETVKADYDYRKDPEGTTYYFKEIGYRKVNDKEYEKDSEHNTGGKEKKQSFDVIEPKVTISTQAHTGDNKSNTFKWGDRIKFYDDVTIRHENILDGTDRAFETILVAVYPTDTKSETKDSKDSGKTKEKTSSTKEEIKGSSTSSTVQSDTKMSTSSSSEVTTQTTSSEATKTTDSKEKSENSSSVVKEDSTETSKSEPKETSSSSTTDSKDVEADYQLKSNEKEVWSSGKIDYKVSDKELVQTVKADYEYTKDPKGTTYYFKEIGYKKDKDNKYEKDSDHNLDGKEKSQSITPIVEEETPKKPTGELPQTGSDSKRMMGLVLLGLGSTFIIGYLIYQHRQKLG